MKKQLMIQVVNSIFEVMETMFFLTLEEQKKADMDAPLDPDSFKTSAITFSGDFSGTIFLQVPQSLLETMTENFLGQDVGTLSMDHVDGTLNEALNMVAGGALTRVDKTVYMGLGIPEIVPGPGETDETAVLTSTQDIIVAHIKLN